MLVFFTEEETNLPAGRQERTNLYVAFCACIGIILICLLCVNLFAQNNEMEALHLTEQ